MTKTEWSKLKMTKIDESKQYKFSEIIAMLEDGELPVESKVIGIREHKILEVKKVDCSCGSYGFYGTENSGPFIDALIGAHDINDLWTIKLPKEDKFYLIAPETFKCRYLTFDREDQTYTLWENEEESIYFQSEFTQKQIDAMPFDTKFFEKVKAEQADE